MLNLYRLLLFRRYAHYTAQQIADLPRFRAWVLCPDARSDQFWASYLDHYPDQHEALITARRLLLAFTEADRWLAPHTESNLWLRLSADIQRESVLAAHRPYTQLLTSWPRRFQARGGMAVAGIALMGALAYIYWASIVERTPTPEPIPVANLLTSPGELRALQLPDGSSVLLSGNSRLEYPTHWPEGHPRQVRLVGKALFSVRPYRATDGQAVKFEVLTEGFSIQVYGTQFFVSTMAAGGAVHLTEGHVALLRCGSTDTLHLQPGDHLVVDAAGEGVVRSQLPRSGAALPWQKQVWTLDGTPLGTVSELLRASLGVQTVFLDSAMASQTLTGPLSADNVELVREILQEALGSNVRRSGDTLYFFPRLQLKKS